MTQDEKAAILRCIDALEAAVSCRDLNSVTFTAQRLKEYV